MKKILTILSIFFALIAQNHAQAPAANDLLMQKVKTSGVGFERVLLPDPGGDRILLWDDSASSPAYLNIDGTLSIAGNVLSVVGGGGGELSPWADADPVILDVLTRNVQIGGNVPLLTGKVEIKSTADTAGLVLQGFAGQTAFSDKSIEILDLGGNTAAHIDVAGNIAGETSFVAEYLWAGEQAALAVAPAAGFGYVWVKNTVPSTLMFTNDVGTAITLGTGSGNVGTDVIWNVKGDLAVGTGSDTAIRLGVGTNGQILSADSAEATGLKWIAALGEASPWTDADPVILDVLTRNVQIGGNNSGTGKVEIKSTADTSGLSVQSFAGQTAPTDKAIDILSSAGSTVAYIDVAGGFVGKDITSTAYFSGTEQASLSVAAAAGFGYVWVKNTVPSTLIFTNDVGTDVTLGAGGGAGDFVGPASSTDNAVVRFDLATGKLGQNSTVLIDDSGNVAAPSKLNMANGGTAPTNGIINIGNMDTSAPTTSAISVGNDGGDVNDEGYFNILDIKSIDPGAADYRMSLFSTEFDPDGANTQSLMFGYNLAANGAPIDATKSAMGWAIECPFYFDNAGPGTGDNFYEQQWRYVRPDGTTFRLLDFKVDDTDHLNVMHLLHTGTHLFVSDPNDAGLPFLTATRTGFQVLDMSGSPADVGVIITASGGNVVTVSKAGGNASSDFIIGDNFLNASLGNGGLTYNSAAAILTSNPNFRVADTKYIAFNLNTGNADVSLHRDGVGILRVGGGNLDPTGHGFTEMAGLTLAERTSDPANPAEGQSVQWQSEGTGFGDAGDVIIKITEGGVTKTVTLVDFSAATDEEP